MKYPILKKAGFSSRKALAAGVLFSLIAIAGSRPLEAAAYTWDALNTDGVITDGVGTWDLTSKNWWNSGSDNVWVQGSDVQIGQIGGAGATTGGNTIITLATNISVGSLYTANNDNKLPAPVTINTGANTLTFSGSIATATDLTINGNVAFTNGLNSLGVVTIGGASTPNNRSTLKFTGSVDVGGGAITMSGNDSNSTILSGTVINVSGINEGNSTLSMTGTNAALTGSATINVTNGTLSMSGTFASNYAQTINVSGGTLDLTAGTYGSNFAANISQTNGTLKFKSTLFTSLTGTWGMSGGSLVLNGGLFSMAMGTGNGQFDYTGGQLGVSATGTYNFGGSGALLTWGSGGFNPTTALTLQSTNQVMTFANAIDLNSATTRTLQDGAGNGGGSLLIMTGIIQNSSTGNLEIKATTNRNQGDTWIDFAAASTYSGTTFISGATGNNNPIRLILGASGSYSSAAYAITGTTGGQLQIMPGNAGTTYVSGNITTPTGTNNTTNNFTNDVGYTLIIGGTGTVNNLASGTGVTVLTGTNTYTGSTFIKSGTLQIGNGGAAGSLPAGGGVNSLANTALVYNTSSTGTLTGLLTGSMSFTQAGTGMIVLANTETYTGSTSITSGTLQLGNGATNGSVASGTISNAGTLVFNTSGSLNYAGKITGAGAVAMSGNGNQTLSGLNDYTGATSVNSGTLRLGSATALGNTSSLTVAGGATLNLSNGTGVQSTSLAGNLVLGNGAMLNFGIGSGTADQLVLTGGATATLTGTTYINLLITGTGVSNFTIISSNNPFNLISGGTFALGTLPTLTTASLIQTSSALQVTFSAIPTVFWKGSGTSVTANWSDYSNFTSDITGTAPINAQFGSFQDVVFSANGATNQNSTVVDYNATAKSLTINDTAAVTINGSAGHSLTLTSAGITTGANAGNVNIGTNISLTGAANLTANNAAGITIGGTISTGANPLVINGTTIVRLTGTNTNPGLQVQSGTLNVNSDSALGAAGNAVTFNGGAGANGVLQFAATGTTAATRNYVFTSGTGTIDTQGNAVTISGTLSGSGTFNKAGSGQLIVNGGNDLLSGSEIISGGTFTVASPGNLASSASGSSTYTINSGATMELNATSSTQYLGNNKQITFAGNGTLLKSGASKLVFNNNNVYITMSAGGIFEIQTGSFGNGENGKSNYAVWTNNLGSLKLDANTLFDMWDGNPVYVNTLLGSGTFTRTGYSIGAGTGLVIGNGNGSGTFSGVITNSFGTTNVTKQGTGLQVFTGHNSYSGATVVAGGTLQVTTSNGLGFGDQTFQFVTGQHTTSVSGTGGLTATLDINGGITVNTALSLSGAGILINSAAGTTSVLDSGIAGVTYSSNNAGTSSASAPITLAFGSGNATGTAATINNSTYGNGNGGGSKDLVVQVLSAGSGYTPGTAPTVTLTQSGTHPGGTVAAVVSSLALTGTGNMLGGNGNLIVNAQISGTGGFATTGTGTLTLSGSNIYTGPTTVASGNLRVTNTAGSATGTNTVTIMPNSGGIGTLSGVGTVGGAVTATGTSSLTGVAHLAPGINSTSANNNFGGAGTLSIGAGLTIGNGTNLDFDLGASGNDLIAVTGAVSLGSNVVLNVNQNGAITVGTAITLISYTGLQPNDANLASWTTAFLPSGATGYTFADTGSAITITFTAAVTNNSTLAITPSPISLGNVLVGATPTSVTGTIANNGTTGTGTYTLVATGSASASGSGTLAANGGSTTFTVGTTGTLGGNSGNNVVVGTVGASNSANVSGSATPVNVTANLFQTAALTASTVSGTTLQLTSGSSTDGGQRAGVTVTGFTPSNTNFQITTQNSGTVGVTTTSDSTVTVATVDVKNDRLSGTYVYNGTVTGSIQYTDAALAAQGSIASGTWTGVSVTKVVSGATSSGTTDIKHAAIANGSSYAGYGLTSGVTGGKGQPTTPTVAQILAGTASGDTTVNMAFSADGGHPQSIFQSSDTLSLSGINQIGNGGSLHDNSILTDTFVLQISYVTNTNVDNSGGNYYIGWWDSTRGAWVNAIAGNSNSVLPRDYIGTGAFAGTYASYDTAFRAAHPEDNTDALVLAGELGAYGYDSGTQVAWAVLNHNSEFEVIPEPSTYAMIFSGFGMLIGIQRFRRRKREK